MSQQEYIEEGDELIGEFMEWHDPSGKYMPMGTEFKYHTSWDWIMSVVEKIKGLSGPYSNESDNVVVSFRMGMAVSKYCEINYTLRRVSRQESKYHRIPCDTKDFVTNGSTLIEAVWLAVVEFIKWHQKSKNL